MQLPFWWRARGGAMGHAVGYALVAALFLCGGLWLGGNGVTAATVVSHIPFVGDNLDATPDPSVNLDAFWEAWNALNVTYVNTHASTTIPTNKEKIHGAIAGLAASYGDPYTVFFPPAEAKAFNESISGTFAGVGIELDQKDGQLVVVTPLKGTPAEAAGIKAGDLILAIDGRPTEGMATDHAVTFIRGKLGTVVTLTIMREGGRPFDVKITRAKIDVPETDEGLNTAAGVYHIALYEFTANSDQLFNQALQRFLTSGSDKLVIDLRGNPGGYLDAAVDIASHFLAKGAPVVTEDFGDKERNNVHTSYGYGDVPSSVKVAVLVDQGSASASEILAGALQDNEAATVIGTRTFGKGSVQTLIDLDGGALKVTVARWVTPGGNWIMDQGITPDIESKIATSTTGLEANVPGKDPQYDRAVQFLTTGR